MSPPAFSIFVAHRLRPYLMDGPANSTHPKPTGTLDIIEQDRQDALITLEVQLSPEDYRDEFNAQLKRYSQQMNMPGFRKGHVPRSLVVKQFGTAILQEITQQKAFEAIQEHIEENGLKTYGQPLLRETNLGREKPVEEQTYSFHFDLGLQPNIEFDLDQLPQVTKYQVDVGDKDVEELLEFQQYQNGEETEAETLEAGKVYKIGGTFEEVNEQGEPVEDGVRVTLDFLTLHYQHFTEQLAGKSVGDKVPTRFTDFFRRDGLGARLLKVPPEAYEEIKDKPLHFRIDSLQELQPRALDEDFQKELIPEAEGLDEAEFRAKLKEKLQEAYDQRAQQKFELDLQTALLDQADFELPAGYVQQLMLAQSEEMKTPQELVQNHPTYLRDFKLHLVQTLLQEQYPELQVGESEVKASIKESVQQYMGGAPTPPAEPASEQETAQETEQPAVEIAQTPEPTESGEETAAAEEAPDAETTEAMAQMSDDAATQMIEGLVDQLAQDEQYASRTHNQLQSEKFVAFLRERAPIAEASTSKQAFDELTESD